MNLFLMTAYLILFLNLLWIINLPFIVVLASKTNQHEITFFYVFCLTLSSMSFMISYLYYKREIYKYPQRAFVLLNLVNLFHVVLLLSFIHYANTIGQTNNILYIAGFVYIYLPVLINSLETITIIHQNKRLEYY
jgi:hypothetical protein